MTWRDALLIAPIVFVGVIAAAFGLFPDDMRDATLWGATAASAISIGAYFLLERIKPRRRCSEGALRSAPTPASIDGDRAPVPRALRTQGGWVDRAGDPGRRRGRPDSARRRRSPALGSLG